MSQVPDAGWLAAQLSLLNELERLEAFECEVLEGLRTGVVALDRIATERLVLRSKLREAAKSG